MSSVFTRGVFLFVVYLVMGGGMPVTLHGQTADSLYSIVGQTFLNYQYTSVGTGDILFTAHLGRGNLEVILVANRDTLRTISDSSGFFSFSGIPSKQVALFVEIPETSTLLPFYGTFELMPTENIVIIPMWYHIPEYMNLQLSNEAVVTSEGDAWVIHYPSEIETLLINRLKDWPGVEYDKRKNVLFIPKKRVHISEVNGAYVFALEPQITP